MRKEVPYIYLLCDPVYIGVSLIRSKTAMLFSRTYERRNIVNANDGQLTDTTPNWSFKYSLYPIR